MGQSTSKRGGVTAGEKKSNKKANVTMQLTGRSQRATENQFGTFPSEKQTVVQSETVFIMHKYLSGYMSHREPGFMQRKLRGL